MFSRSVLIGLRWTFFQDLIMSRDLINKKGRTKETSVRGEEQ